MADRATSVLIVDDDADLAESLAEILGDRGCDVAVAADGREAVDCVRAWNFDVIFMDVRMPVMNGVDAFFAIRAIDPQARIVMMTGFREPILERAIQAGAEALLHKPFGIEEMLDLVDRAAAPPPAQARPGSYAFLPRADARPRARPTHTPSGTVH